METTLKRLYVGGISPLVTKAELEDRFGKFGKVDDVEIIYRNNEQGNTIKTFAYLNVNISDADLKKCMSVLNKSKWKGGILQIEIAKESFLQRLSQERQEVKEKEKAKAQRSSQNDLVLSLEKAGVTDFHMKTAVPGTEVPNHENWVVSKFGRVLPVLHFNGKKQSKIKKYDPSKYCHNIRKVEDHFDPVPVSQLTWQMEGGDDEISRKRRGEFPNFTPHLKKKKLKNTPINGGNHARTDEDSKTYPHSQNHGRLQSRSSNMTEEYDTEDELQTILKTEKATKGRVNDVEGSDIEVVDDSFQLSYTKHKAKQKAAAKMINSTSDTLYDSEYDSADTDEIITSSKKVQKSCDSSKMTKDKAKDESDKCSPLKIHESKEGSTYTSYSSDKCTSKDAKISMSDTDSEMSTSDDDSSSSYSDEEYKDMMQNCFRLSLSMGDLETLAKETNELESDDANDTNENDSINDTDDDINAKQGYGVTENTLTSEYEELPTSEKKQKVCLKKKLKTENIQSRELESDATNSDFESINENCSKEMLNIEALQTKSPRASKSLNNHELEKGAKSLKEANKSKEDPVSEPVKKKKKSGIEPDDIVASILEEDNSGGQQSNKKKEKDAPVKPPEFKGLSSVLASAATIHSQKQLAAAKVSSDVDGSSSASKKTNKAGELSKDLKQIVFKEKSEISITDNCKERNSDLNSTSLSAPKPAVLQTGRTKEKITPNVKQQQDNQKRLVAMMERSKERELQKQIIQGALQLDSRSSKKHIVFESESESEKEEEASTSEKQILHADKKAKQDASKLFSSSEDDSDNEDEEDNKRFEIKAQYEGKSGMKLMQLQSRFRTDERFKMDSRFLESSSEDEEPSDEHQSKVDEEYDLSTEKKKSLDILQSILNVNVEPQSANKKAAKGKKFKDLNALHYDPAKEEHATFETKTEEKKERKSEKKKRLEAEKLPDVSKETFHEITMDFREVFGASKTENTKEPKTTWDQEVEPEKNEDVTSMSNELFTFQSKGTEEPVGFTFSFFGNTTEESTSNNEPYKTEAIKPAKVAWQEDPRFQDSSSEGEDEEDATVATENKTSRPDLNTIRFFFFVKDDKRLKTGPTMFFRSSNTKKEDEAWEQRKDILLEECRKRHKDAKRKIKAKS